MSIGSVVKYKNIFQVVVEEPEEHLVKILDPATNKKLVVRKKNPHLVQVGKRLRKVVLANGSGYLVSPKGLIISMTSSRVMKWDKNHGIRKQILASVSTVAV